LNNFVNIKSRRPIHHLKIIFVKNIYFLQTGCDDISSHVTMPKKEKRFG